MSNNYISHLAIKNIVLQHKAEKNINEIINFLKIDNIVININKVSFTIDQNVHTLLNQEQIEDLIKELDKNFNIKTNIDNVINNSKIDKDIRFKTFYIANEEDFKIAKSKTRQNPEYQDKILKENILKDIENKKIEHFHKIKDNYKELRTVSFDFEFNPNVLNKFNFINVFEVGISIQENNKINSYHYIIEENSNLKNGSKRELQSSFNFGHSEYVSFNDIKDIIEKHLKKDDIIVVHEHSNDLKILNENKIEYNFNNVKDTQKIFSNHFRKSNENENKKLKNLLDDHFIHYKNLHNAGNDSRYTLMLYKSMCKDYLINQRKIKYNL